MPTDSELISSFNSLSSDARAVLEKLVSFVTSTGDVTWNLSGGVSITVQSLNKLIGSLWKDNLGNETGTFTYDSQDRLTGVALTTATGHTVLISYTYTNDLPTTVTTTFRNPFGGVLWSTTRTYTYTNERLTSIS